MPADSPARQEGYFEGPRVHRQTDDPIILENQRLRAVFSRETMELISLVNKADGMELLKEPSAYFQLVDEQTVLPYSAWTVGQAGRKENLNRTCFVRVAEEDCRRLRSSVTYEMAFRSSVLKVTVSLAKGASLLRFRVDADWHEIGCEGKSTPQLRFCVPYGYEAESIRYDVPGGCLKRPKLGHDVPAVRYAAPAPKEKSSGIFLTSDGKYGYRGFEGELSLNLLRSSIQPDRYPEYGIRRCEIGLGVTGDGDWQSLTEQAMCFAHPIYAFANTVHGGSMPQSGTLLRVRGSVDVLALKQAEDGAGVVLRLGQSDAEAAEVQIGCPVTRAEETDLLEQCVRELPVGEEGVMLTLPPKAVRTVKLCE